MGLPFLAGQLLYLAVVLVGLVRLVVPGIFLAARLSLFSFQIGAKGSGVLQSFRQSAELTPGATGRLSLILVALVVFNLTPLAGHRCAAQASDALARAAITTLPFSSNISIASWSTEIARSLRPACRSTPARSRHAVPRTSR